MIGPMSDPQRSGEAARRSTVAERRAEREAAIDAGAVAPHSVQPLPRRTLFLVGAGTLAALGMLVAVALGPVPALAFFVPAMALGGFAWRQVGVERPVRRALATDPLTRAYEDARRAIDQSPRLEADRRLELLAVLDGGFDQLQQWEGHRAELERARGELEGSDAPEASTVSGALDDLEARRAAFVSQCDTLRRTVTALDLQAGPGAPDDELAAATADLRAEVDADAELASALRAARVPQGRDRA